MKDATPPCTPVWSLGVLKNFGGAAEEDTEEKITKKKKRLESTLSIADEAINHSLSSRTHRELTKLQISALCCLEFLFAAREETDL